MLARWFATPGMLAVLAAVPLLGALGWYAAGRRRRALSNLGNSGTIQSQVLRGRQRSFRGVFWTIALALLIVAAAGPRWAFGPAPPMMPGRDIVLVVDLSRSMLARDVLPSRLGRAKESLADLIAAVQDRGGHRLALVVFAGRAKMICPLTHDYDHVRSRVAALEADPLPRDVYSLGDSGTRIGAGIVTAVDLHEPGGRGSQDIVLVSDGDDPVGDDEWRSGYRAARAAGIPVHVVGIGDPANDSAIPLRDGPLAFRGNAVPTRLNEAPLRETATKSGGVYISAGTLRPDLGSFVRDTINKSATREAIAGTLPQRIERHEWFLVAGLTVIGALLCLPVTAFRLTRRLRQSGLAAGALVLVSAAPAHDVALHRGTEALEAARNDEALAQFAAAAERSTDPGLVAFNSGIALYRLGRYREAELQFRCALSDADGTRRARTLFNLGCALAQSSRGMRAEPLKGAIAAFEQALAVPEFDADYRVRASENLELAKRLLAQLPPEKPAAAEPPESGPDPSSPTGPAGDVAESEGANVGRAAGERSRNGKPGAGPKASHTPSPGKGNLPPLTDNDAPMKLTPDDAKAHLDRAAARIARSRKQQLQHFAPMPSSQFPDW